MQQQRCAQNAAFRDAGKRVDVVKAEGQNGAACEIEQAQLGERERDTVCSCVSDERKPLRREAELCGERAATGKIRESESARACRVGGRQRAETGREVTARAERARRAAATGPARAGFGTRPKG